MARDNSEESENKQEERHQIKLFVDCLPDLPFRKLSFGDKPDAKLCIEEESKECIGIEHTRLYVQPGTDRGPSLQAQEQHQDRLIQAAWDRYNVQAKINGYPMLRLIVRFDHSKSISRKTLSASAMHLTEIVTECVQSLGMLAKPLRSLSLEKWRYQSIKRIDFPDEIESVLLDSVESHGLEIWGPSRGWVVPIITVERIQETINGKLEKLSKYSADCRKAWLVIVTQSALPSSSFDLSPKVANAQYSFNADNAYKFDRVFYFDAFTHKIVELNKLISN